MNRCSWAQSNELYIAYHDSEWGVPVHDDRKHFEFLVLESAQAGLSWLTILKKRDHYRQAYNFFDLELVSAYDEAKIEELIHNAGIVRNRRKIESSIHNARLFLQIQEEHGSFDRYIWSFVDYRSVNNSWLDQKEIPVKTTLSDRISDDLKKKGFRFIGSTIIYAHLQATGMVNDHIVSCFRYRQIKEMIGM